MRLFGFTYDHVGSIILLMLGGAILSYPCEILTQVICKLLVKSKSLPINGVLILYVILDTLGTMIGLGIVDLMMDSVKTNQLSLLVIGLVFALLGYKDMRQELTM